MSDPETQSRSPAALHRPKPDLGCGRLRPRRCRRDALPGVRHRRAPEHPSPKGISVHGNPIRLRFHQLPAQSHRLPRNETEEGGQVAAQGVSRGAAKSSTSSALLDTHLPPRALSRPLPRAQDGGSRGRRPPGPAPAAPADAPASDSFSSSVPGSHRGN